MELAALQPRKEPVSCKLYIYVYHSVQALVTKGCQQQSSKQSLLGLCSSRLDEFIDFVMHGKQAVAKVLQDPGSGWALHLRTALAGEVWSQ